MMADINDSYYARNEKWIRPALIAFIFAFGNSLGDILGVASPIVSTASTDESPNDFYQNH